MRKNTFSACLAILLSTTLPAQTGQFWNEKTTPEVRAALERGEKTDFIVIMRDQADVKAARQLGAKTEKAQYVYAQLRETAARTQSNARRILRERGVFSNSFYIVNAIAVEKGDAALARRLAALPEVKILAPDPWINMTPRVAETENGTATTARSAIEWGVERVNAPAVWAMGFSGQGITVGGADTGYEWDHPAIKSHYRGWDGATGGNAGANHNYNWHDAIHAISPLNGDTANTAANPCGLNSKVPCDDHSHGTHTAGTMTGDDGQGNQIGVAPGAKWVGCRNMERGWGRPSTYIECFEWFLAPTDTNGLNPNPKRAPHVINNSWYCAVEEGCTDLNINDLLREAIVNLKPSGVVVVVSNGNNGSACATTTGPPAYFAESFSVGATRFDDTIAGFSSRGPVFIDGSRRIKPNVSAPGQGIRSCVRFGGYATWSGTSMAGPHVAGVVALLLSARPELSGQVEIIEAILEQTAAFHADITDCNGSAGNARPNHAYGWGRVDALAAVNTALAVDAPEVQGAAPLARVFPNPAVEQAVFDLQQCAGNMALTLFNAAGQRVFARHWTAAYAHEQVPVPLSGLPKGVYFWQLRGEKGVRKGKLIKQ